MIRTESLTKRYGASAAVDRLTVEIPRGSVVGVMGPTGSGKTTLLRLLLGLTGPSSGRAFVLGHDVGVDSTAIRRRCGLVPEAKALYRGVPVREFLHFYGCLHADVDVDHAAGLLRRWDLDTGRRADRLSRGDRAKVLLAAVLARSTAEVLFLDEPSEGLDPAAAEDLWTVLMRRVGAPDGVGAVMVSHRIDEIERVCDRVVVLEEGRLVLEGELDALRSTWRRLLLHAPEGDLTAATVPGLVDVRRRDTLLEVTTSAWSPALVGRIPPDVEVRDVRSMGLREIYLSVVRHDR